MVSITKKELKEIKSLRTRKGRRASGRFAAEGVRLLEEAIRHDVRPELLLWSPALLAERGHQLVQQFRRRRVQVVELAARELNGISESVTSQGIMGVFDIPQSSFDELLRPEHRTVLLCDGISDPGNLGTLLRCALAFRFNPVLLTGKCADPYTPKVVRASVGAIFGVDLIRTAAADVAALVDRGKFRLIAADVNDRTGTVDFKDTRCNRLILAVGSEAEGLSESILKISDCRWRLEHERCVDSLNAAVAAAIMMQGIYHHTIGKRN